MTMASGIVLDSKGKRAALVGVVARRNNEKSITQTLADGSFSYNSLTQAADWSFYAFEDGAGPHVVADLSQGDKKDLTLTLRQAMTDDDWRIGRTFFAALVIGLIVLACGYGWAHQVAPPRQQPLGAALSGMIDGALDQLSAVSAPNSNPELMGRLDQIKTSLGNALAANPTAFNAVDRQVLTDLAARVQNDAQQNMPLQAQGDLRVLRAALYAPIAGQFMWTDPPLRYTEALFWGLAGVLVYLIITVGSYLRWRRFYSEGLPLEIASLVTQPLVALVIVLLLSVVNISLSLGGTQASLNVQDPQILAAVAFLLTVQPWETWRLVRGLSSSVTNEVQGSRAPAQVGAATP